MEKNRIIIYSIIFSFILTAFTITVQGLEPGYCVKSEVSDISPSSIEIGEELTVGIQIENCGIKIPGNVSFEIINLSPHITIKESPLTQIGKFHYSDSKRFITYHMKTSKDASPGEYEFTTILRYGDAGFSIKEESNITINVIGDEAELSIASVKTSPILPYEGNTIELTLRIENFGDGVANSVKVRVDHDFQGIKEAFIGTLDPNEDGPAIFTFIADRVGEFEVPVEISFEDDFGEKEVNTKVNIIILKKKINWIGLILGIVLAVAIGWFIFHFFRTKKSKDNIIQQLLKENGSYKLGKEKSKRSKK